MLIPTPEIDPATRRRLAELDRLRESLGRRVGEPAGWMGTLRRSVRARSAEGSISIEGFHVPEDEVLAVAADGRSSEDEDEDRQALVAYTRAMDHVGVMASDPAFEWSARAILDLHFDACSFQRDKEPGRWRSGPVRIVNSDGSVAYEGPDASTVPDAMAELVEWLRSGDLEAPAAVRAPRGHRSAATRPAPPSRPGPCSRPVPRRRRCRRC